LGQTKTRTLAVDLSSSPARPNNFGAHGGDSKGPGAYDQMYNFGSDVNGFTIGVKREQPIE